MRGEGKEKKEKKIREKKKRMRILCVFFLKKSWRLRDLVSLNPLFLPSILFRSFPFFFLVLLRDAAADKGAKLKHRIIHGPLASHVAVPGREMLAVRLQTQGNKWRQGQSGSGHNSERKVFEMRKKKLKRSLERKKKDLWNEEGSRKQQHAWARSRLSAEGGSSVLGLMRVR